MKITSKTTYIITALVVICVLIIFKYDDVYAKSSIVNSKHDLSATGGGKARATSESRVCIFCHTTHTAAKVGQLWNRDLSYTSYIPYTSSSMVAKVGQPTGTSKLCLSCHDGTIALGKTFSDPMKNIQFQGGITTIPSSWNAHLGTNLSNDHPVSFKYNESGPKELRPSSLLANGVKLDHTGDVQCTSCHDVHDDSNGNFLVTTNRESKLCISCHAKKGWEKSNHSRSNATWRGRSSGDQNPWPKSKYKTVRENGCGNCHFTHSAPGKQRLLKNANQKENCIPCHNGKVAKRNINASIHKGTGHGSKNYSSSHDPLENYAAGQVSPHVECADCHNVHESSDEPRANPPYVNGATQGVPGINSNGEYVAESRYVYEICYKCHGDNINNIGFRGLTRGLHVTREIDEWNTRFEFDPSNSSYHPIEAPAKSSSPSLIGGSVLPNSGEMIYCHDCHNDSDKFAQSGPHGSKEEWLLGARYVVEDPNPNNTGDYAICFKCHSETSILSGESFEYHNKHIINEGTPCSVCHDPHGVMPKTQGHSTHLINFDTNVVFASNGQRYFVDYGNKSGGCVLVCHGVDHNIKDGWPDFTYGNTP